MTARLRVTFGAFALAMLCATAAAAQEQTPSLSAGRIGGELVVGAYAGVGGFFIGRYVGDRLSDGFGVTSDVTRSRMRAGTGVVFAHVVTTGAVYGIGNIGDQTGDLGTTALGTTAGMVAAIGLSRVILGPGGRPRQGLSTAGRWTAVNVVAFLPAIGATVAFNSSRRFR